MACLVSYMHLAPKRGGQVAKTNPHRPGQGMVKVGLSKMRGNGLNNVCQTSTPVKRVDDADVILYDIECPK